MRILERLTVFAGRMGLDDPLVEPVRAHAAVRIGADGRLLSLQDLPERTWLSLPRERMRSSNAHKISQILWDKPPFVLGHPSKAGKRNKLVEKRLACRDLHRRLAELVPNDPRLAAAASFVARKPYQKLAEQPDGNYVLYYQDDEMPIGARAEIRDVLQEIQTLNVVGRGICPVMGIEDDLVIDNHAKVKPLPGANSSGGSLVSFDPQSSWGWGKRSCENMQIGKLAFFAYPTAARWLLTNRRIHLTENVTATWWCAEREHPLERIVEHLLAGSKDQAVEAFDALQELEDLDGSLCFAALQGAQGRAHVAWFDEVPAEALAHALLRHVGRFSPGSEDEKIPSIRRILFACARPDKKNPMRNIRNKSALGLVHSAIGISGPSATLVLDAHAELDRRLRCSEDGALDPVRLRALGSALDQTNGVKLVNDHGFDIARTEQPYVLGSLFAVMEEIQRRAIFSIARNKRGGITERSLVDAKSHPSRVFPRLQSLCRQHIIKLQKRRISGWYYLDKVYLSVSAKLEAAPPTRLSHEGQGLFMMGYDHTRLALRYRTPKPPGDDGDTKSKE